MPKFRKKPVGVEAMRFDGENAYDVMAWVSAHGGSIQAGVVDGTLAVRTPEGLMSVLPGAWVVRGVAGEFYPCKPDIFDATYEAVEDA